MDFDSFFFLPSWGREKGKERDRDRKLTKSWWKCKMSLGTLMYSTCVYTFYMYTAKTDALSISWTSWGLALDLFQLLDYFHMWVSWGQIALQGLHIHIWTNTHGRHMSSIWTLERTMHWAYHHGQPRLLLCSLGAWPDQKKGTSLFIRKCLEVPRTTDFRGHNSIQHWPFNGLDLSMT